MNSETATRIAQFDQIQTAATESFRQAMDQSRKLIPEISRILENGAENNPGDHAVLLQCLLFTKNALCLGEWIGMRETLDMLAEHFMRGVPQGE